MLIKLKAATIGRSHEELDWRVNTWRIQRDRESYRLMRTFGYQWVDEAGVGNIDEDEVDADWQFPLPLAEVQAQLRELNEQIDRLGPRAMVNFFYNRPYDAEIALDNNEVEGTDDGDPQMTSEVEATDDDQEMTDADLSEEEDTDFAEEEEDADIEEEDNAGITEAERHVTEAEVDADIPGDEEDGHIAVAEENADIPDNEDSEIEEEDDSNGDDGEDDAYIPDEEEEDSEE